MKANCFDYVSICREDLKMNAALNPFCKNIHSRFISVLSFAAKKLLLLDHAHFSIFLHHFLDSAKKRSSLKTIHDLMNLHDREINLLKNYFESYKQIRIILFCYSCLTF